MTEETGTLHDTYHVALQHDHVQPADDDLVLGVVRKPMYGIQTHLDRNCAALAPPADLLDEFKETADEMGHNAAVAAVDFRGRYRDYLDGADQVEAIRGVIADLESGRDVWLVCYENTDEKFCHREILVDVIRARRPSREVTLPSSEATTRTEFVCMPCYSMVSDRTGHVTVHGDPPTNGSVWCPWCADAMDRASEVLTEDELAAFRERSQGNDHNDQCERDNQ